MLLIGSFLLPLLIGFVVVNLLWPKQVTLFSSFLLKIYLAYSAGLGLSSCSYFLWLVCIGVPGTWYFTAEMMLAITLLGVLWYAFRNNNHQPVAPTADTVFSNLLPYRILSYSFLIALFAAVLIFFFLLWWSPHGGWDSWAIWNLRARFLFRSGEDWRAAFSPSLTWSHPDYPLLLPCSIARCWSLIGFETLSVSWGIASFFTLGTAGLLFAALEHFRTRSQAMLAVLVLIGFPQFLSQGASQCADVPFGFFCLATLILFGLYDEQPNHDWRQLVLAGLMAGLAAWTKNEGILFLPVTGVARASIVIRQKGWNPCFRELLGFSIGALPITLVLIFFKLRFAPPNDLVSQQGVHSSLAKLLDFTRYFQIFDAFSYEVIYSYLIPCLLLYLLAVGFHWAERLQPTIQATILILILMFAGYFLVFVTTPNNLAWHLSTTTNRLFLQFWPSFLLIFFMVVQPLEHALGSNSENGSNTRN